MSLSPGTKLPVLIAQAVRAYERGVEDEQSGTKSHVHEALDNLNQTSQMNFSLDILWGDIYDTIKDAYPDKTTLVPRVRDCAEVFLYRLDELLQSSTTFRSKFLQKMAVSKQSISIQVHEDAHPKTHFVVDTLTLFLPKTGLGDIRELDSRIGSDLAEVFGEQASETKAGVEDFVEVDVLPPHNSTTSPSQVRSLPIVSSLERPEILFRNLLPYTLLVSHSSAAIVIQCTHQPTLELIAGYFQRYARKDNSTVNQPPYLKVELSPSYWGTGTNFDVLRISRTNERQNWVMISAAMLLTFIESVCGFTFVGREAGDYHFRRVEHFT